MNTKKRESILFTKDRRIGVNFCFSLWTARSRGSSGTLRVLAPAPRLWKKLRRLF